MATNPNIINPIPVLNPNPVVPDTKEFWHHRMHCQNILQSVFSYWNNSTGKWINAIGPGTHGQWFTPKFNDVWISSAGQKLNKLDEEGVLGTSYSATQEGWDCSPGKTCIDANYSSVIHYDTGFWIRGSGEPYITSMAEIMYGIDRETDIQSQNHPRTANIPTPKCHTCKDVSGSIDVSDIVTVGLQHGDWIDVVNTTPSNSIFGYQNGSLVKVQYPHNYPIPEFDLKRNFVRYNSFGGQTQHLYMTMNNWPEYHINSRTGSAYSSSTNGYFGHYPSNNGTHWGMTGHAASSSDWAVTMKQWQRSHKFNMPIWYIEHTGCNQPNTQSIATLPLIDTGLYGPGTNSTSSIWLQQQGTWPNHSQSGLNQDGGINYAVINYNYITIHDHGNFDQYTGVNNGTPGNDGGIWYYTSSYGEFFRFIGIPAPQWGGWSTPSPSYSLSQNSPSGTYYYPMSTASDAAVSPIWDFRCYMSNASLSRAINTYAEKGQCWTESYARINDTGPAKSDDITWGRLKYINTRSCVKKVRLHTSWSTKGNAGTHVMGGKMDYTASAQSPDIPLYYGANWFTHLGGQLDITTPYFCTSSSQTFPLRSPNHAGTPYIFNKYQKQGISDIPTAIARAISFYTDYSASSGSTDLGHPVVNYSSMYCSASFSRWSAINNRMGINNLGQIKFKYYLQGLHSPSGSASVSLLTPEGWMHPYAATGSTPLGVTHWNSTGYHNYARMPLFDWNHYNYHIWKGGLIKIDWLGSDRNVHHPKAWHSFSRVEPHNIGAILDSGSWGTFGSFFSNSVDSDKQAYRYDITSSVTTYDPYGSTRVKTKFSADQANQFSASTGAARKVFNTYSFAASFPCAEYLYDVAFNPLPQWRQWMENYSYHTHKDDPYRKGYQTLRNGWDVEHSLFFSYHIPGSSGSSEALDALGSDAGSGIMADNMEASMGQRPSIIWQTFKDFDTQPYFSKRPGCTCTRIRHWFNVPLRYHSSAKGTLPVTDRKLSQNVWELTFSDGYSFKCGGGLLLFMYNPAQASNFGYAYDAFTGDAIQDSINWPNNLRTVAVSDIAKFSASMISNNEVGFIKCNDLDPGTTHENGFVYLKDIRRTDSDLKLNKYYDTDVPGYSSPPGQTWNPSGSFTAAISGAWEGHSNLARGRYYFHPQFNEYHFKMLATSSLCSGSDGLEYRDLRQELYPYYTKIITDWPNDLRQSNTDYLAQYGTAGCVNCDEGAEANGIPEQDNEQSGIVGIEENFQQYHCGIVGSIMLENGLYVAFHGSQTETFGYRGPGLFDIGYPNPAYTVLPEGIPQTDDWPRKR
tara:strand:- start:269 stop:4174 length:3906 start_codon:yes stop_codon:yes gene_type:complete